MQGSKDIHVLNKTSPILDYIRQSPILILSQTIKNLESFKKELLELCQHYSMTNVLLKVIQEEEESTIFMLKPHSEYHWLIWNSTPFYPQHWRNFEKKIPAQLHRPDTAQGIAISRSQYQGNTPQWLHPPHDHYVCPAFQCQAEDGSG